MPIGLESVSVWYGSGSTRFQALREVTLQVPERQVTLIMGPSGSGKSSLLAVLGLLKTPDAGRVTLRESLPMTCARERAWLRLRYLGFVFQNANLIASCTALQNVLVPALLAKTDRASAIERASALLDAFGLADKRHLRPAQLSGGEAQRVAICRALVNKPRVLLADEPTAALDTNAGRAVAQQFRRISDETGTAVVIVTHDHRLTEFGDVVVEMEDGRITA